jgi:predicted negative regulator of RcsB-dependent stress response
MSTLDLQEQEQVDALKAWWKENGKWLITVVILAVVAFAAVQYWRTYQARQTAEASTLYLEVLKQVDSNDPKRINDAVDALVAKYSGTAYAPRAQLLAAQANTQVKDFARVKTQLQWVIDHASETGLQDTARLKFASLLLDEKDYAGAMKLLDAAHPDAFVGLYADLKGDVLNAQGKTEEARAAYKQAFEKTDPRSVYRNLIQMKLDALGGAK